MWNHCHLILQLAEAYPIWMCVFGVNRILFNKALVASNRKDTPTNQPSIDLGGDEQFHLVHGWLSPFNLMKPYEKKDTQQDANV